MPRFAGPSTFARPPRIDEVGGLDGTDVAIVGVLRALVGLNLVGADVVEVFPLHDHADITGIAAAHVGYELLSVLAANRG